MSVVSLYFIYSPQYNGRCVDILLVAGRWCRRRYLVVGHVFGVPVALQPVFWRVLFDEVTDAVTEVVGLEEQQLDDEVTHLGLVSLVTSHSLMQQHRGTKWCWTGNVSVCVYVCVLILYQTEDEAIQSDDVVLPHHVVQDLDALVELLTSCRGGKLVHQEIGEGSNMCDQSTRPDTLQNPAEQTTQARCVL